MGIGKSRLDPNENMNNDYDSNHDPHIMGIEHRIFLWILGSQNEYLMNGIQYW